MEYPVIVGHGTLTGEKFIPLCVHDVFGKIWIMHYSLNPLHISLRPSRQLALALLIACAGSLSLLWVLAVPDPYRAVCASVLLVATLYILLRDVWHRFPWSITALQLATDGSLRCMTRNGRWQHAYVQGNSCVTAWLTVLNVRLTGERWPRGIVLLPDSLEVDAYRRLRVWLRWGRQDAVADNAWSKLRQAREK